MSYPDLAARIASCTACPLAADRTGATAAASFLGRGHRLSDLRGCVHDVGGRQVLASYHPSAAIRFGPRGAPMAALRTDLALAATLL